MTLPQKLLREQLLRAQRELAGHETRAARYLIAAGSLPPTVERDLHQAAERAESLRLRLATEWACA